jgi:phosphatidylglycerophosphate synthase
MTDLIADSVPATSPTTVLLRATHGEAPGAALMVGGLSVFDRSLRQLARSPNIQVILAADGSVPVPGVVPVNVKVRRLEGDTVQALAALQIELGTAVVTGVDVVRRQGDSLAGGIRVVDDVTRRAAEDAIFADLLRGDLGFIARHINKKISFRITRYLLCRLPITPNQVTLGALVIGIGGCLLIATGTYGGFVGGLLLMQLQSILDGCDGELARVRFQQSAIGEWLDTLVDDFLNLAIVGSLGIGLSRGGLGSIAGGIAGAAVGMMVVYNIVSYRELLRQGVGGDLIKIRWKLARGRDFKSMYNKGRTEAGGIVFALGRRDTFVFAWFVMAIVGILPAALIWAAVVALTCFVMAMGQLFVRDAQPRTRGR